MNLIDRLADKVALDDAGCLIWMGWRNSKGYGGLSLRRPRRHNIYAHRLSYELLVGPIPEGLVIDHLCRVRSCVHPDHLEPVTTRENLARGVGLVAKQLARNVCKLGHPYQGHNLVIRSDGSRACRTCTNNQQRARKLRKKQASA